MTLEDAVDAVEAELTEQGFAPTSTTTAAQAVLHGLIVGYGMDETAFVAVHGPRLAHLTRKVLTSAGVPVKPQPGDVPKGV